MQTDASNPQARLPLLIYPMMVTCMFAPPDFGMERFTNLGNHLKIIWTILTAANDI